METRGQGKTSPVIAYASNTGGKRNLAALQEHGWRLLLTPDNPNPPRGFRFAIDNGAWGAFRKGIPFDKDRFMKLVDMHSAAADFTVIPDIVAGGEKSLQFSLSWLPKLKHLRVLLLAVQDGMTFQQVSDILRHDPRLGIFVGGSTEFKLRTMHDWSVVGYTLGRWIHVGRVNTRRRIRLCAEAGATSFDGTSATMYSCNLPLLESARRQPSLLSPERLADATKEPHEQA